MVRWTAFPYAGEYNFDALTVKKKWARLHAGDREPLPEDPRLLEAWAHFHNGEFHTAATLGLSLGPAGLNVANKATCVYATYLEKHEDRRLALFLEVAERAQEQLAKEPENVNAHYWHACALGRYSQSISVAKALAQGLGSKVKTKLENVIKQEPNHADAHVVLGNFHAEIIDKVGSLIGAMAYGANRDMGLKLFSKALQLNVDSAYCMVEYARAILMIDGEKMIEEATRLYQLAARVKPADALERIEVEMAKTELED
jgi:tetratricopeptide (TPR) repeat protein